MVVAGVISSVIYINRAGSKSNNVSLKAPVTKETGSNTVNTKELKDDTLTFSVLGDIHGNALKLDNAICDLYSVNNNMDAMILNGDNVDQGLKTQYAALNLIFLKDVNALPKTIIKNIGNHDYFDYARGYNSPEDVQNFKNLYFNFSGEKEVYHDRWIKGYHLISLGSESGNTKDLGNVNASLSDKQLNWLKGKLGENHQKGKPIFVFLHQHLCTSIKGWIGVVQSNKLNKILSQYPEVILFTSHTHVLLNVDNVKQNQPFTIANTGGIHYAIQPGEFGITRLYDESQGLYVEVKGNKTIIKGRDFIRKSWIFSKEVPGT